MFRLVWIALLSLLLINKAYLAAPNLGDSANLGLSAPKISFLGRQVLSQIAKQTPIIYDPLIENYVQTLGTKITHHSAFPSTKIDFYTLSSNQINAFALPGNIIGFNSQLILEAENEGEFAGVMAHEVTHITQNHFLRIMERQKNAYIGSLVTLLAAALATAASPQGAQAIIASGVGMQQQQMIGYVREHEYEADRIGTQVLTKSGYPATDMANFFARLPQGTYHNAVFEAIMTHPLPSKRYGEALNRQVETRSQHPTQQLEFKLFQARLIYLTTRNKASLLNLSRSTSPETTYLNSLILMHEGKRSEPLSALEELQTEHPYSLMISTSYIEALLVEDKTQLAQIQLKKSIAIFPNAFPLQLLQAKIWLRQKNIRAAETLLKSITKDFPNQPQAYELLAQIQKHQSDSDLAHYYLGQHLFLTGRFHEALVQFQLATRLIPRDNHLYQKSVTQRDLIQDNFI